MIDWLYYLSRRFSFQFLSFPSFDRLRLRNKSHPAPFLSKVSRPLTLFSSSCRLSSDPCSDRDLSIQHRDHFRPVFVGDISNCLADKHIDCNHRQKKHMVMYKIWKKIRLRSILNFNFIKFFVAKQGCRCPREISVMSRVRHCWSIRELQSLLPLGTQTRDHECGPRRKKLLAVAEPSSPFWIYNV